MGREWLCTYCLCHRCWCLIECISDGPFSFLLACCKQTADFFRQSDGTDCRLYQAIILCRLPIFSGNQTEQTADFFRLRVRVNHTSPPWLGSVGQKPVGAYPTCFTTTTLPPLAWHSHNVTRHRTGKPPRIQLLTSALRHQP